MVEWFQSLDVILKVLSAPSLAMVIAGLWRYVVRPSVSFIRRLNAGMVKLADFDPEKFAACVSDVANIKAAVGPNGGRSLYDRVEVAGRAARLSEARMSTMLDVVVDRPLFQADDKGEYTWVNSAFEKAFETSCDDVRGRGWINLVVPEDRDRVVREWRHAIIDRRDFSTMARFRTSRSHRLVIGSWSAQPICDDNTEEVIAWLGAIDTQATQEAPK